MSLFLNTEDGYFSLTTGGEIALIAVSVVLVVLTALFRTRAKEAREAKETAVSAGQGSGLFSTKQMVFSAVALALGFVASYIKLIHMPWGGSITLCSMLFVVLIGYWYGPKVGLTAAFAYGLLQFVQGGSGYILSPLQVCVDYIFAFASLGLSGFFCKQKNGLVKGYLVAVLVRGLFHSIGGYLYWMDYMPDNFPRSLTAIYPFAYNYAYILGEALLTVVVIQLPPVKKAIEKVREIAY